MRSCRSKLYFDASMHIYLIVLLSVFAHLLVYLLLGCVSLHTYLFFVLYLLYFTYLFMEHARNLTWCCTYLLTYGTCRLCRFDFTWLTCLWNIDATPCHTGYAYMPCHTIWDICLFEYHTIPLYYTIHTPRYNHLASQHASRPKKL